MKNLSRIAVLCFLFLISFFIGCASQSRVDGFFDGSYSSRPARSSRQSSQLPRARESSPAPSAPRPVRQPAPSSSPSSANPIPAQSDRSLRPDVKFVPWSQSPPADNSRLYTVQKGDSLFSIARKFYSEAGAWKLIYQANQEIITDPESLPAGLELRIP